jgi:IclR-like helix-turn-helix domain-containing protein
MPPSGLEADVAAFLDAHIDSIPQLEILLLLHEGRGAAWTVEQIAARIYQEPSQAQPLLRGLQSHGLVEAGGEGAGFRYAEGPDHHEVVDRLARAYRTDLIGVTRFVHAKASRSVLEFARAFDLKKDRP